MRILDFDSEDDWLRARRQFITATMIARLAKSRAEWPRVWEERATGVTGFHGNRFTEWGKQREPAIGEYLRMFVDSRLKPNKALFVHDDDLSAATPDMVLDDGDDDLILAEIKTVTADRQWSKPAPGTPQREWVPSRYYDQVQWQLFVTGAQRCVFAWEPHEDFVPQGVSWVMVERDGERIDQLCAIRDEFLDGKWRDDVAADSKVDGLLSQLAALRAEIAPLAERENNLLDALREALGDSDQHLQAHGLRVSWVLPKPRKTWQKKAFEAAHPDLVAEFTKEIPAQKRTLRVQEVKTDA